MLTVDVAQVWKLGVNLHRRTFGVPCRQEVVRAWRGIRVRKWAVLVVLLCKEREQHENQHTCLSRVKDGRGTEVSTSRGFRCSLGLCGLYMSSEATSDVSSHHPNTCTVARLEASDSGPSGLNLILFPDPTFYFLSDYGAEADGCGVVEKLNHSFKVAPLHHHHHHHHNIEYYMYNFYYGLYIIGREINWQENIRKWAAVCLRTWTRSEGAEGDGGPGGFAVWIQSNMAVIQKGSQL